MLKLWPLMLPLPCQLSCRAQPPRMLLMLFVPATLPLGSLTSQSPIQKSNCRYSGPEQAGGAGAAGAVAGGVVGAGCCWAPIAAGARVDRSAAAAVQEKRLLMAILQGRFNPFNWIHRGPTAGAARRSAW